MRLQWLDLAVVDLDQRLDDLDAINPPAAARMAHRIDETIHRLIDHPNIGRAGVEPGSRELVVRGTPLIVVYQIEGDDVVIVRVRHAAQRWPRQT